MDLINLIIALFSIGFGAFGWLAPRYTMQVVDLADGGSTMGMSEVRAASGGVFVITGLAALLIGSPAAYLMAGLVWGGGATGRLISLIIDGQTSKKWYFFAIEAAVAVAAIANNWSVLTASA
ncbi:MAG: DUF4345 family protein [Pseudomonadota bacterium]